EYYYAITTVNQAGENLSLIPDGNYTTVAVGIKEEQKPEPVIEEKKEEPVEEKPVIKKVVKPKPKVKKKKAVDYSVKLEKVIHDYYYKSEYEKAVKDLNWILKKSSSQRVKNKANLFLGKSYFYTGEYKKALNIFIILKPVYPDEASFWIQQVLRKLR
ncbi:MAG: tetratricopeptide repeat protein, partial [Spirochaetes bacterium]|nr:tetratricopeptide repeat protein [Spirochaetota bacterium]